MDKMILYFNVILSEYTKYKNQIILDLTTMCIPELNVEDTPNDDVSNTTVRVIFVDSVDTKTQTRCGSMYSDGQASMFFESEKNIIWFNNNSKPEDVLLKFIPDALSMIFQITFDLLEEMEDKIFSYGLEESIKDIIKNIAKEEEQDKRIIIDLNTKINNTFSSISGWRQTIDMLNLRLRSYSTDAIKQTILDTINKINKHKKVENVTILKAGGLFGLEIKTVDLYFIVENIQNRFYLGKFTIFIPLNSGSQISLINNTQTRAGYFRDSAHPHVDDRGIACFGSADMMIMDAMTSRNYYNLFTILLGFLQSVNINDVAGSSYYVWDQVNDAGEVVVPGRQYGCSDDEVYNDDTAQCCVCGEIYDEDDLYYCDVCCNSMCSNHLVILSNGNHICTDCAENGNYMQCPDCDQLAYCNDMVDISEEDDDEYQICDQCVLRRSQQERDGEF
jgi:hypothetical protein